MTRFTRFSPYSRGVLPLAVAILVGACTVYDPSLVEGGVCGARPPSPPGGVDDRSEVGPLVFALKGVTLNTPEDVGLSVDGLCTTADDTEWECLSRLHHERHVDGNPETIPRPVPDGPDGIDNAFRGAFTILNAALGDLQGTSRIAQGKGIGTPIVRVSGYNGLPDDPLVEVVISTSVFGIAGSTDAEPELCLVDEGELEGEQPYLPGCEEPFPEIDDDHPGWDDGSLWFRAREDSFLDVGGLRPRVQRQGYVRDYVLAVKLPDNFTFILIGEGQAVQANFSDTWAIGDLNPNGDAEPDFRRAEVLVAGRWPVVNMLSTARSVGICPGDGLYDLATNLLESRADVVSDPILAGEFAICDALSFAVTFDAYAANWRFPDGLALGQGIPDPCSDN